MVSSFLFRTINLASSLCSDGYSANRPSGNSYWKLDNFIFIFLIKMLANIQSETTLCQVFCQLNSFFKAMMQNVF